MEEPKEGDEKKEPAAKAAPVNAERREQVNKANNQLISDATALGVLQISAEDFATVIGYRKARNANSVDVSGSADLAVAGAAGSGGPASTAAEPMPGEKKAPDEKMEKN